jgi:hypothetical protein
VWQYDADQALVWDRTVGGAAGAVADTPVFEAEGPSLGELAEAVMKPLLLVREDA